MPFVLRRTYRQGDSVSRAFGIGASQDLDTFLTGDFNTYQYIDLINADRSRIHYVRTAPRTDLLSTVFVNATDNTAFYGSTLWFDYYGFQWVLRLRSGTVLQFHDSQGQTNPLKAALNAIQDRYGNALTLTRNGDGALTNVTTPNGRWISLQYNSNGNIAQATDNLGRTTQYSYDEGGRLVQVTDPAGAVTRYSYDADDEMLTITDPRGSSM